MKLSVIIPVYNEADTIAEVIGRVMRADVGMEKEIVVVDDGSDDGTADLLSEMGTSGFRTIRHEINRGKGAALRTGFALASGDIIVIQDADLEYDPANFGRLIAAILAGEADIVLGSRFSAGRPAGMTVLRYAGNRFVTGLSNFLHGTRLSDMETGHKAFRREVLDGLPLASDRFGFEPEFTILAARRSWRIVETPVAYVPRTYAEGKKITFKDGVVAITTILRLALSR